MTVASLLFPGPPSNGHAHNIMVENMDNPALTANPDVRNTLTPIPTRNGVIGASPNVLPPIINHV